MSNDWEELPKFNFDDDLKFANDSNQNKLSGQTDDGVAKLNVNFEMVKQYISLYPDRVFRNIYQGGLMNELV